MKITKWWVGIICWLCLAALANGAQILTVPSYDSDKIDHDSYYFTRLLTLALDKTRPEFGDYELRQPEVVMVDDRLKAALVQGGVDLLWHTSVSLEDARLQAVPVSLLGELSQYRLLLIRSGEQQRFSSISSLAQLRQLTAGVGAQWPGVRVLESNELPLVTATGYPQLFRMLAAGRFDYFPRGIYQIISEVGMYPELDLAIESDLMLSYPNHIYFFVRKGDDRLAERILLGLERARADGEVDALIDSIPRFRWAREELQRGQRRVIHLQSSPQPVAQ